METAAIEMTLFDARAAFSRHRDLACFLVWRSIGSNMFLEFGAPTLKHVTLTTRSAFTVLRGEASIGIHGDRWRLMAGPNTILDSVFVDEDTLKQIAEPALGGATLPVVGLTPDGMLTLIFDRGISIVVEKSDYGREATDIFDEVSIILPSAALGFNYARGFYVDDPLQH